MMTHETARCLSNSISRFYPKHTGVTAKLTASGWVIVIKEQGNRVLENEAAVAAFWEECD